MEFLPLGFDGEKFCKCLICRQLHITTGVGRRPGAGVGRHPETGVTVPEGGVAAPEAGVVAPEGGVAAPRGRCGGARAPPPPCNLNKNTYICRRAPELTPVPVCFV